MRITKLIIGLVCAILLFTNHSTFSQQLIPRFEHLGINDGLPHSSVYSITQDKKGFMWFGTPDGLCRYDGSVLQGYKYHAKNPGDIINNFVRGELLEDGVGNIWYSNESGIYKWDVFKEKVAKIRPFETNEFGNQAFKTIALDPDGTLWLLNYGHGIFAYNILSGHFKQFPIPLLGDLSSVLLSYYAVDKAGNIWIRILSNNDPYVVFSKSSHKYSVKFKSDPPHAIFFSSSKTVYAYTDRLVYVESKSDKCRTVPKIIDNKKISFYSFDGVRDNYGRLWMTARGNGLFYYDEKHDRFQEYHHDNSKIKSLPFDLTTCLYIDRSQNLWIGIDGGGVARLDLKQPKFNVFPLSEGDYPELNDYFTKCFYEDERARIWFGSHSNGLNILDPGTGKLLNYHHEDKISNSLPGNMVGSILKDREGNIWIGSSGGISIFDEQKGSFNNVIIHDLPKLHPAVNIFVFRMIQLQNGDLLAATLLGLIKIVKQNNGNYEGYYFRGVGFLISTTTDIVETHEGIVYATVPGLGLYELKPHESSYILSNIFLNGIDLRSVRSDETDSSWLWVSTGKGLVHFNTISKQYSLWNEKNGLANSYVYGSLEDGSGNLWMSTNGGLSQMNRKKNVFENYSYQDGLQSNEFNTQAFYKSPTGVFYFGGIKGFNWFKPGPMTTAITRPQANITKVEINEQVFEKDSGFLTHRTITVPYHKNEFNLHFAALDYTRPEANKIQYKLEGWDGGWITTNTRSVRYANLSPGKYIFRVKISNAEGIWSGEEKIYLNIEAPFWQRTWFSIIVTLLIFGAVILLTYRISQFKARRKLQLLEKQIAVDTERNRISADMHDEIGSGITHIALFSELIQKQEKGVPEIKNDIRAIAVSSRKLVQTMSEIIWALNPQNETLENLLAYTREQSQQYFDPFDVEFVVLFPDEVPLLKLTNAERRNLYLVTKELLHNAMKHANSTSITLKLEISKTEFCFTVSDNGKGMKQRDTRYGSNGIRNLKKRMEDIGGSIEWLPGNPGTQVKYCLYI